jgi:Spy/CpxP family protein refolding chaperone
MAPNAASDLNLTTEQSGKLQTQRESYLKEVTPLQNQLFGKKAELRLLWGKQNPDRAEITAKQNEILDLQRKVQEKATSYRLDCRSVLTPEQQSRMTAFGPGYARGHGPRWGLW